MSQTALGAKPAASADASQVSSEPKQAGLVLATLIIVAAVANLPLAMANVAGDQYAYIAVLIGAALVFFIFPKREQEQNVLMEYNRQDMAALAEAGLLPSNPSA